MNKNFIQIGKITTTHGIKGEVKILPCNDEYLNLNNWNEIFLEKNKHKIKLHINSIKYIKQFIILGFKEFNNINQVTLYKNCKLYINIKYAIPLNEGQYYIDDLLNINVILDTGNKFGVLHDVIKTGANDVYLIHTFDNKKILIPAIPDCILNIDLKNKIMLVHLLNGLI